MMYHRANQWLCSCSSQIWIPSIPACLNQHSVLNKHFRPCMKKQWGCLNPCSNVIDAPHSCTLLEELLLYLHSEVHRRRSSIQIPSALFLESWSSFRHFNQKVLTVKGRRIPLREKCHIDPKQHLSHDGACSPKAPAYLGKESSSNRTGPPHLSRHQIRS